MKEEIFGPIIPILTFKHIDEVYEHMYEREKPLAMYYFGKVTNNENKDTLEKYFGAGAMVVNDVIMHAVQTELPFGGVGYSGQGAFSGKYGLRHFTYGKPILVKPVIDLDALNKLTLPPYSDSDVKSIKLLMGLGLYQSHLVKYAAFFMALFVLFFLYRWGYLF